MDKTILLQKQVRDNSDDLRSYLKDLAQWEEDMKRKDTEIGGSGEPTFPIPRNKSRKIKEIKKEEIKKEEIKKEEIKTEEKPKKIKSYDYAAWDKFDVDAECDKLDKSKVNLEENVDSEEEDASEEYKTRLRDEANFEKERGNQFVKNKKWNEAISCYTHSIACYSKDPIYFANRALCFLKKDDLHSAEADCTSALQLDSTYVKALQRRSAAREGLKQLKEAAEDLRKVLEIEPHNKESKKQLEKIEKRLGIKKEVIIDCPRPSTSKENLVAESIISKIEEKENKAKKDSKLKEDKKVKNEQKISRKIPWPQRPSSEIILPVQKHPHQRSKKPLKRVEILESSSSEIQLTSKQKEKKLESSSSKIIYGESNALAQTNQTDVDEILNKFEKNEEIIEKSAVKTIKPETAEIKERETNKLKTNEHTPKKNEREASKIIEHKTNASQTAETIERKLATKTIEDKTDEVSTAILDFPVPKSSVQFYTNWKALKNNNESRFLYLKQIKPAEIPNIFKDSMESEALSDIIFILSEYFPENKLDVYEYLNSLSTVKRFSALTMFMTLKDKIALKKIFEYCEDSSENTKEALDLLRKKYEL